MLNVAPVVDDAASFHEIVDRLKQKGYPLAAQTPMKVGEVAAVMYGYDDQGNSVEVGYVLPGEERNFGWRR